MRKKYAILILILVLLTILIIVSLIVNKYRIRNQEEKQIQVEMEKDNKQKSREEELEEKKQELIKLCEENQEEFEVISEEMLEMLEVDGKMKDDITWRVVDSIGNQVKNPEWERLSEFLIPYYPLDESEPEGKIYYQYWSRSPYALKILYINVDEQEALEYLSVRFDSDKYFIRINEHLYVCIENEPGV